jgi:hypothetical protein
VCVCVCSIDHFAEYLKTHLKNVSTRVENNLPLLLHSSCDPSRVTEYISLHGRNEAWSEQMILPHGGRLIKALGMGEGGQ